MPRLKKPLDASQRMESREEILRLLESGEISIGQAIRRMRLEWTGLSQGHFGKLVGLSANTISAIERNEENATLQTLNQILRRFGMELTIRPCR